MGALSNYVSLTISQNSVGVTRAGFGTALILSVNATFPERVRTYNDLSAVAADFAVTTSPEYRAAQAVFAQSPSPQQIKIGRAVGKPTQAYTINITSVISSNTYTLNVEGQGVTTTAVTYTSDGTATDAEIAAGLVIALNAVVGKNYTAAGAASPITVTGSAAGSWFSIESPLVDVIKIAQTHAEPGTTLATDLNAINVVDSDWYSLVTLYNSNAYVLAAAAWVNSNRKIYLADVSDSESVTLAMGGSDTLDDLKTFNYDRVAGLYHPSPARMFSAALNGRCLALEPGSETWANKPLTGVPAAPLTATHRTNLVAKRATSIETVAGVAITFGGQTADGDYIDVQRGLDWLDDAMTKAVFGALIGANKISFTDFGIAVVEAEIYSVLSQAEQRTIITSGWRVEVPKAVDITTAAKAARTLSGMKFFATLDGAIHKININGSVSV